MEQRPNRYTKNSRLILIALLLGILGSDSLFAGTITVTGTLSSFLTSRRVASASQSYTVSGTSLGANNIVITAPGQYEVSTNNTTFSSSVSLTPSSGTVSSTTIYVRMAGTFRGSFSGNITHANTGSTTQNLAVTGKVNRLPAETYYQGINSPISSNGNGYGPLPIGFTFSALGGSDNSFNLSANGYIQFPNIGNGGKNVNLTTNSPIPAISAPTGFIAVFWDGLYIDTTACYSVLYKTIGSSPNRKLVIQYTNAQFNGTNSPFGTAQIILYEGSNNVRLQYRQLLQTNRSYGQEASVGIEFSGTAGTQYSYNASSLYEGLSILYTPSGGVFSTHDTTTGSYDPILLGTGSTAPPGIPDGEAPGPASTSVSQLAKFWWKDSPNISTYTGSTGGYRLKASINADLSSPLLDTTIADTSFRLSTVRQLTGGTTYYWQVTARGAGCIFTSSEIYSFVASTSPPRYATFSPTTLNMGSLAVGSTSNPTTVTITGVNLTGTMTATVTGDYTINGGTSVTGLSNGSTLQVRFVPTATGSRTGRITLTGGGLDYDEYYDITGTGTAATPTITTTGTLSAFTTAQGTPSSQQSYTVSATGLTANLTVTPPTGYEVSTTSGASFGSSVTLTPTSGTVASTTIYVRVTGSTAGTFSGNISHASTGATTQNVAVSGTVRSVTVSGTLAAFSTPEGTASSSQSYTVSGSGLSGNITITAPSGFEIRTGSNAYSGTVTLVPASGSVSSTTIDVRMTGASGGSLSGTITHVSSGASSPTVAVSGTVRAVSTSGTLSAFSTAQGTPSASQSYTVSGTGVSGNITITAPTGFEIRTGSNAYSGTVTLIPTSGSVSSTTIDVRLTGTTAGLFSGNITNVSTGASSPSIAVTGSVGLITTTGTLSAFSTPQGTSSSSQSYTVSASGLMGNLTITAPGGYEIRTGSNSYSGTVTLTPTSGSVSSTTIDVRLAGTSAGSFSGNITNASTGATTQNVAVTGTVGLISITGTLSAFSTSQGTPSASQSYTVSGSGLTGNITITAPTGYEIRTGSNAYAGTVTLTPSSGSVSSTTIDVRLMGATAGTFAGNITNVSTGATTQNVATTGTVAGITVTGTLTAFSTPQGTASSSQSYTVSGSGLAGDITITAPTGYEIRTGSNAYAAIVTLTPVSGSVSSTTIDVRLTGTSAGLPSGNITHASSGATTQNKAVSGSVGLITVTGTLSGFSTTQGTASSSQNYTVSASGLAGDLTLTAPTGYEIRTGSNAYAASITLTPSSGSVSSTTIDIRLTGTSGGSFSGNISHTSSSATTQDKAVSGTVTGPTVSISGTLSVFSTTQGTPSASQSYTVSGTGLTTDITITAPTGFEIRTGSNSYAGTVTLTPTGGSVSSTTIDVRLTGTSAGSFSGNITNVSSGATTQNIAASGTTSLITITGTLSAFSTAQGTASSSQSYTVSASGLTGDLTITAPTGYEIRTGSNTYAGTVTLSPTSGSISTTTIDVRLTGNSAGNFSGDITNASTGATTQNVGVSGTVGLITVTGTLSSFSTSQGTASSSQSYTVSGSGLTGNITITAPTGYEIRTGSNSYGGTVTLTPTSGSVSSTTIDVRLTGTSGGTFTGNISNVSTGATTQNVAVSGTVAVITVTGTLSAFSTPPGTPSSSQSYTVSATGLTASLTITAPGGYEIRTGSNAYSGTVTLTPASGVISSTTIDARLTGASAGTFAGNITNASTGAATQNVAVTGTVSTGVVIPTVTTTSYITAITLTAGTAAGNVTADGGASITARGVCWNLTGTPTIADSKTTDGTGTGSFTSSITGLTNATVYYVRAYATNSVGTAYSATVKFTAGRIYVNTSATGVNEGSIWADAYTNLATAISRIDAGEVWVAAGTYKPTATTDRTISFTAKNNVALLGGFAGNEAAASSRNSTTNVTTLSGEIGAAGSSDNSYHVVSGTGLDLTAIVDGFTITAGNSDGLAASNYDKGAGLYLIGSPFLKRLNITGNTGTQAIGLYNLGAPTISYVTYGSGNTWIVKR